MRNQFKTLLVNTNATFQRTKLVGALLSGLVLAACSDTDAPIPDNTPTPLVNTAGEVTVTGDAITGAVLSANVSDFNGAGGAISYEWRADGMAIPGATSDSYTLTTGELGSVITVAVSYTDDAGFSESLVSDPTAAVTAPPNAAGSVVISGVPTVGEVLTADVTDGNGLAGSTITYQWLADGGDIAGATAQTFTLTAAEVNALITVTSTYTDDDGYPEAPTSAAVGPINTTATNVPGSLAISGTTLIGEDLTAVVTDANGATTVSYQWQADGTDIMGATNAVFTLTSAEVGSTLSVSAAYTDDDGFTEGPLIATAADIVYSAIVTGEASLLAAAAAATDGDVIGIDSPMGDDYADMAEVEFSANDLTIQLLSNSTAVITGATCVVLSGNNIVVDGLRFDDLDWIGGGTCDSSGDASVILDGDGITLRNSEFLGEAIPRTVPSGDPYHYVSLRGVGNIIERNLFQDKDMDNEGAAITAFANTDPASNNNHTIQYNLFRDFPGRSNISGNRDSTAHALQLGRTTGSDAQGDGFFVVQYNRFEGIQSERRLMRVQSGGNTIRGNTVVDSLGLIALEDGYANTVTGNVILSAGDDGDDGGISFAPLGHTITGNYINNLRTTSSQRGGLLINPDPLSGSGNGAILGTAGLDFTVTIANNSIVNARRAIIFEDADCAVFAPILDVDDNFVMNQSSALSINSNTNGEGRDAVTDNDFVTEPCSIDPTSDFDGNRFYSASLSQSGTFDFNGAAVDNVSGPEDGATFAVDGNGLANASGADAGAGVDTSTLVVIDDTQVGPGSTWTPSP
ncbi:MAG: chondroitinase-B domain-containing protein [Pseudomonadota bacterium]